ncbi:MAG TPA: hypothetical protein VOA41_21560 [Candidatus Dormibacteraeota bacterium]|nr:hypothetical protein [Candidatus Dormibacteraeota bacterium]
MKSWSKLFLCATLLTLLCQFNAAAQEVPKIISQTLDKGARAAALTYWTAEKLQAAIPMDLMHADSASAPAVASAPLEPGSEGATPAQPPSALGFAGGLGAFTAATTTPEPTSFVQYYAYPPPYTRSDVPADTYDETGLYIHYPQSTIGKLFFTLRGINYVCSASVARPHLLVTARHCVYDGMFATNEVFYPGWHSGPNVSLSPGSLGGGWPMRTAITWGCSPCGVDAYDIAFIQTFDDDGFGCGGSSFGAPIEAYTGWLGTSWAGNVGNEPVQHYTEVGYPQGAPFNGNQMVYSRSSTEVFDLFGYTDTVGVGSDMTGGSSGGPWIVGWNEGSVTPAGGDYVNGLNSYKFISPSRPEEMHGPQFKDYNFNQLRLSAEGLACP